MLNQVKDTCVAIGLVLALVTLIRVVPLLALLASF
jgi:hypothetical protein